MRPLEPGTVVAGYRIESLVGRGGMGVVYRALQLGLERIVALKVIAPELLDDEDIRRRFLAEARAAASVDHPNVIPVHEAGEDDGIAFIAMRFVAGSDLRSLVRARRRAGPGRGGGLRRPGGRGAGRDPPRRLRPPRRQAREPAGRLRRPRLPDRLRPGQAGPHRHRRHAHRPVGGDARLRRAGADPRRPRRRPRRRLRARRRPALRADRAGAVRARGRRGEAVGAALRPAAGPLRPAPRAARRARRGRRPRDGQGRRRALPVRRRPRPRRPWPPRPAPSRPSPSASSPAAPPRRGRADRAGLPRGLDAHRRRAGAAPPRRRRRRCAAGAGRRRGSRRRRRSSPPSPSCC